MDKEQPNVSIQGRIAYIKVKGSCKGGKSRIAYRLTLLNGQGALTYDAFLTGRVLRRR